MDENNAKNYLQNFIQKLGHLPERALHYDSRAAGEGFESTVTLQLDGRDLTGAGFGFNKKEAEKDAANSLLQRIYHDHPDLNRDWTLIRMEAQAGDALIKLCIYLNDNYASAAEKSYWLQTFETDQKMTEIFDEMHADRDPRVTIFGKNLGAKRKATYIEALIWREYGQPFRKESIQAELTDLFAFLGEFK